MSMKTKEDDKQSGAGADIVLECLRCAGGAGPLGFAAGLDVSLRDIADPDIRGLRHPSTREPAEQSQNVYENKGPAQESTTPDPS